MPKTLPFDCLLLVLDAVDDLATLNALLRVSRAFFRAAASQLYRDPFAHLARAKDKRGSFHAFERLVLSLSPANDVRTERYRQLHYVQKATHGHIQGQCYHSQPLPTTDYLGLIRHFHWGPDPREYIRYMDSYRTMAIFAPDFGMNSQMTAAGMQHLLTWAACGHQPERIESVYIYAGETSAYLDTMDKWTNLQSIVLDVSTYGSPGIEERTYSYLIQGMQLLNTLAIYRGPRSLLSLRLTHFNTSFLRATLTKRLVQELHRHQAPLRQPIEIGPDNWDRFSAWAGEVDFSHLQSLILPPLTSWDAMARWWPDLTLQEILQRSCRLSRLEVCAENPSFFQWAVETKVGRQSREGSEDNITHAMSGLGDDNGNADSPGDKEDCGGSDDKTSDDTGNKGSSPYPLKRVLLHMTERVWDGAVNDLLRAFGDTLEHLMIRGVFNGNSTLSLQTSPLCIPRLRSLSIKLPARLLLGPDTLCFSPQLEHIALSDVLQGNVDTTIKQWKVCRWPNLSYLHLTGSPSVQFHPASLHECQQLRKLTVQASLVRAAGRLRHAGRGLYPNLNQENRARSLWTWDWYLPQLTNLTLKGEYAAWFEMKLLAFCPRLEALQLQMTWSRRVNLVLPKEWYETSFPPSWPSSSTRENYCCDYRDNIEVGGGGSNSGSSFGPYVAQALKSISLDGRWDISDETLETLLLNVCPALEDLELMKCGGFTTSCLLGCLRRHPSRISMVCSRQVTRADMKMMGITTVAPVAYVKITPAAATTATTATTAAPTMPVVSPGLRSSSMRFANQRCEFLR